MLVRAAIIYVLAVILAILAIGFAIQKVTTPANSADAGHMEMYHGDAQHDQWMRSLKRPDTGTSCCSLRDCNPTDAKWHDGQWWANVLGTWRPIPPEKIVHDPPSIIVPSLGASDIGRQSVMGCPFGNRLCSERVNA